MKPRTVTAQPSTEGGQSAVLDATAGCPASPIKTRGAPVSSPEDRAGPPIPGGLVLAGPACDAGLTRSRRGHGCPPTQTLSILVWLIYQPAGTEVAAQSRTSGTLCAPPRTPGLWCRRKRLRCSTQLLVRCGHALSPASAESDGDRQLPAGGSRHGCGRDRSRRLSGLGTTI